jgi:hypothetical protein
MQFIVRGAYDGVGVAAGEFWVSTLITELQPFAAPPDEAWELLQRVVNSQELRRASRLRDLLLYIGTRSLKEHAASIREQEIGANVFGRPEDYDTTIDNIVRVNVSELRKRLEHYFMEEGSAEPVLIQIPRGGYLPVFLVRPAAAEAAASAALPPAAPEPVLESVSLQETHTPAELASAPEVVAKENRRGGAFLTWALVASLAVALAAIATLFYQNHVLNALMKPWQSDPGRAAFWSHFFASGQQVDIVTADTSYALAEDILQRPISLDDYLDYNYKSYASLPGITAQTRDALNLVLDRNTGSVGDFEAAERVLELGAHSPALKLASARAYTADNIKRNNVILIGSRESNPWVELYKDKMNFFVEYDPAHHQSFIVNHAPAAGEQAVYEVVQDPDRDYSVVAFVPNLSANRYALIIAGTDSQGTRAAGEFITSSEGLAAIRERMPAEKFPYFEVLLSSSRLEGTTLNTSIQAFRGFTR